MEFGVALFWISYIIAAVLLYHVLRCIYVKGKNISQYKYEKTDKDKRMKHPLWVILGFITVFFIPVLNLIVFLFYLGDKAWGESEEYNQYYIKSIFTKEF